MGYEKRIKQRMLKLCDIPHKSGRDFDIRVEAEECGAIAERLQIVAVNSMAVTGSVSKLADLPIYRIGGEVKAEVILSCVVTMEEFAYPVALPLDWDISADPRYRSDDSGEATADLPEYTASGEIDVVEYAVQTIGLHLPAYPRHPQLDENPWQTADWQTADSAVKAAINKGWLTFNEPLGDATNPQKQNPFAVLQNLHKDKTT